MRKIDTKLGLTIAAAAVFVSAGAATGVATRLWYSGAEPETPGGVLIAQSSESTAGGITLRALSATFSGTETVLNFRATDEAGNLIDLVVPDGAFTGDGFRPIPPQGFQRFDFGDEACFRLSVVHIIRLQHFDGYKVTRFTLRLRQIHHTHSARAQ